MPLPTIHSYLKFVPPRFWYANAGRHSNTKSSSAVAASKSIDQRRICAGDTSSLCSLAWLDGLPAAVLRIARRHLPTRHFWYPARALGIDLTAHWQIYCQSSIFSQTLREVSRLLFSDQLIFSFKICIISMLIALN